MTFEKGNTGYFLLFILIGGILGSAIGSLFAKLIPSLAVIRDSLTGPVGFNLEIISFSIKLNLASIIGIIVGVVLFKKS
jgi:hypothetical protein